MTPSNKFKRTMVTATAVALAAAGPLAACGDDEAAEDTTTTAADATTTTAADAAGESALQIENVWARAATAGGNSAVYMNITGGDADDALVGASVSTEVAETTEVHETVTDTGDGAMPDDTDTMPDDTMPHDTMAGDDHMPDDTMAGDDHGSGMMTMRKVDSVAIPAGGTATLEPGGYHIMLMNLAKDLAVGDIIEVTLDFDSGATATVTAEVREL